MFKLFGYWTFGRRAGANLHPGAAVPAAYSDALLAGWVPPMPDFRAAARPVKSLIGEAKADVASFLERFYLNQQC